MVELRNCPDCGVSPGSIHKDGCDVEVCSVCAGQRLTHRCKGHNKSFARWTGIWPGGAEADYLDIDLNALYENKEFVKAIFIRPGKVETKCPTLTAMHTTE